MSEHSQDQNWAAIPIAKFSHNLSPSHVRSFTWAHVSHRDDLDLILQHVRVVDEHEQQRPGIVMKITAGAEVLESQELGELMAIHQDFNSSPSGEHPVEIVIKNPFLAMRYPKPGNMIQRIQIKFRTGEGFAKTLETLTNLGFLITDKAASATVPPSELSNSVPTIRSSDGWPASTTPTGFHAGAQESLSSNTSMNMARPPSATPALLSRRPPSSLGGLATPSPPILRPSSGLSSQLFTSSPLKNEYKIPSRPVSANSETLRPLQIIRSSSAASSSSHGPSPAFSDLSVTRRESIPGSQGQAPPIYLSQLHKEANQRSYSFNGSQAPNPNGHSRLLDMKSQVQSTRVDAPQHSHAPSHSLSFSPHFPPYQRTLMSLGSAIEDPFVDSATPSALTMAGDPSYMHDDWIPPKRELPFKRPQSVGGLLSAGPDLPPLPKPTLKPKPLAGKTDSPKDAKILVPLSTSAPVLTPKPAPKKRIAQRKPPASKAAMPRSEEQSGTNAPIEVEHTASENTIIQNETSPLAAKSAAVALTRPSSAPLGLPSKAAAPVKKRPATPRPSPANKRPKMVDQSTQTTPSIEREVHWATRQVLSNRNEPELVQTTLSCAKAADVPPTPPESYLKAVDDFITNYKDRFVAVKPMEIWDAAGYDEMDEEKRLDLINDFLCKNLENPQFIRLCEDMEHSWRRIGFM